MSVARIKEPRSLSMFRLRGERRSLHLIKKPATGPPGCDHMKEVSAVSVSGRPVLSWQVGEKAGLSEQAHCRLPVVIFQNWGILHTKRRGNNIKEDEQLLASALEKVWSHIKAARRKTLVNELLRKLLRKLDLLVFLTRIQATAEVHNFALSLFPWNHLLRTQAAFSLTFTWYISIKNWSWNIAKSSWHSHIVVFRRIQILFILNNVVEKSCCCYFFAFARNRCDVHDEKCCSCFTPSNRNTCKSQLYLIKILFFILQKE